MGINITAEDTLLFEQNGFTYEDVKNTVSHYRNNGLSDDEIQGKLNARVAEFKNNSLTTNSFDSAQAVNRNDAYVQQCDYDLEQLSNLYFTPEQLKEMDSKGAIGWWELAKKTDKTERLPFAGAVESGVKATKLNIISNKIEKGEEVSEQDKAFLDNYMREYIETSRRGTTWGAKVADVVFDIPAWATEIAAATAVSGGSATIPAVAQKVATKSGAKAALAYTTKALVKSAQKATVKGVATTAAKATAVLSPRVAENYAQRRITEGIAITDKGEAYLQEIEEKPATTLLKAFADTAIEAGTEVIAGQYLNLAGTMIAKSGVGKAVSEGFKRGFDLLPKKTRVAFESAVQKLRPNETVESLIKKGGFNGVLEEMGEERVADILRTTLDLDPEEGYSADQFMKAINPGADQLLVELGAFSILGGVSRASSILYNNLRVKGYSHEEATNTVNNLSEIEKDNFVSQEIIGDNFTVNSDITKEEVQEYEKQEELLKESGESDTETDYNNLNPVLQRKLPNYASIEEFYRDYSIVENLTKNGAKINEDGTVTLYHAGNKKEILEDKKFKATSAAKGGMTGYETNSVFFGFDKEWVKKWSSGGSKEIIEINVPFEYIKQPAQNEKEVYLDGDVILTDESKNIWVPQDQIYNNFYTQIPAKRAEAKLNNIFEQFNNQDKTETEVNAQQNTVEISKEYYQDPKENILLPNLLKEDLQLLGKQSKPVMLKSNIVVKNKNNHPEIDIDNYNEILSNGLYNAGLILQTNPKGKPNYYNFIARNNGQNDNVVIELSENKDSFEIVGFYKLNDKALQRKIRTTNKNGGQSVITERFNLKGQQPDSALQVGSSTNIIANEKTNLNPTEQQKTARERLEEARNNYKEYKKVKKESERFWSKILAPISTELDEINPKLKHALRRFEMESALKENEYAKPVKAFIDATNKMSKEDYAEYDLALKNRDVEMINELNKEYGIQKEFEAIRQLLDGIYKEAQEVGMEIGMLEDYFPRKVINPAAFIEEVSRSSFVRKALKELDPKNKMSAEDKAIAVNNILRGYGNKISLSGGGFTKERSVKEITPELNKYYKDSIEALTDYIKSMNNVIQAKKFFGKGENVEESIGGYVKALAEQGMISARDEAKAKEILLARFTQRGTGEFVSGLKNIAYLTTMGSPTSAITQIGDFAFSLYQNGFYDSLIGFSKALSGKGITREDIGIDKIAQEFSEKSKTSQAVNVVFKAVGLDFMDKMGKETFINASYKRLKDLANKPNDKFESMLKQVFGKEANQVKEDLQNGVFSENVKYLLFSELSDFQPISLAEMPQKYLTGGNGRVFYQLKTYTIKQLDIYRNQIFRQFQSEPQEAIKNLVKLSALLVLANATADVLKDLLLGRPIDLDDLVIDNLWKLVGFSKWQIYKAKQEGLFATLLRSILPPTNLIDDLYKDIVKTAENKEISFNKLNTIKDIPIVGKLYYWWFGKGSNTEEKSGVYNKFSKKFNAAQKANTKLEDLQGEEAASFREKRASDLETYMVLKGYNNQIKKLKQQRKLYEKANNKEGVKNINARIDEVAKAGLEALR